MKKHEVGIAGVAPGWQRVTDEFGKAQYLPAKPRRELPILGEVLPPAPVEPAALLHAWQTPVEGMVEQTSAIDRAKGVTLRSLPVFATVALLAVSGAIVAYGVAGQTPAVLTFLLLLAIVGGGLYLWESRTEYAHSRHGVERLRIVEAADLEHARLERDAELRKMALESYLKIMEQRYRED